MPTPPNTTPMTPETLARFMRRIHSENLPFVDINNINVRQTFVGRLIEDISEEEANAYLNENLLPFQHSNIHPPQSIGDPLTPEQEREISQSRSIGNNYSGPEGIPATMSTISTGVGLPIENSFLTRHDIDHLLDNNNYARQYEYPKLKLEEKQTKGRMHVAPPVEDLRYDANTLCDKLEDIKIAHRNIRSIIINRPVHDRISQIGLHRLAKCFDIKRQIDFDKDDFGNQLIFSQEIMRCSSPNPEHKFGLDIEKTDTCDSCYLWEECCEMNGVYERQEEICQKDYRYIEDIVLNNLKQLSVMQRPFHPFRIF